MNARIRNQTPIVTKIRTTKRAAEKKPVGAQKQREFVKKKPGGKPFEKGNLYAFKPGESGNPGGLPKDTPKLSVAYMKLLALAPEDLKDFKPSSVAEWLAFKQVLRALGGENVDTRDSITATEKIADRTEGRASQSVDLTSKGEQIKGYVNLPVEEV